MDRMDLTSLIIWYVGVIAVGIAWLFWINIVAKGK